MSRRCLIVFPVYLISEAGSRNRHKGRLERSINFIPVESRVAELTAFVRCVASSTTTSGLPCQLPSYSEVMALTDSSKASLLFFCGPFVSTPIGSPVITYLAKGRSCYLSVQFPLIEFCHHDIVPEKLENLVGLRRLGESLARGEYRLWNSYSLI